LRTIFQEEINSLQVNTLSYKTKSAKKEEVQRKWLIFDADNAIVGRLATRIATILRGKHKPSYTPHVDTGDFVVVINAGKVRFTGNKMAKKEYSRYSGYPGGQRTETPENLIARRPNAVLENAVRGMLPKNKLGRKMFKKMFVYAGAEHPHTAQKPEKIETK